MASTDVAALQRAMRRVYERARLRRAVLGVLPVLAVIGVASCFAARPTSTLCFGAATMVLGALLLWIGGDPQRAVLPGVSAGMIPMSFALVASRMHICGPNGCTTLCVPACSVGGIVAGLAVAAVGRRRGAGPWFWVSAWGLALLTGAMGCACVGYSGMVGLGAGFVLGVAPGLARRALGRAA